MVKNHFQFDTTFLLVCFIKLSYWDKGLSIKEIFHVLKYLTDVDVKQYSR